MQLDDAGVRSGNRLAVDGEGSEDDSTLDIRCIEYGLKARSMRDVVGAKYDLTLCILVTNDQY